MKKTEIEKKYHRTAKLFSQAVTSFRTVALDYLKSLLEEHGRIYFNFNGDSPDEVVCVAYDGGRHPEYNSNMFSIVISVFLDGNGNILLELDEDGEYGINHVCTQDIYSVIHAITDHVILNAKRLEKDMKRTLRRKAFNGSADVSQCNVSVDVDGHPIVIDTVKYDKDTKSLKYYGRGMELPMTLSDRETLLGQFLEHEDAEPFCRHYVRYL